MKREDMVEELEELLLLEFDYIYDYDDMNKLAEKILVLIENKGMLPPEVKDHTSMNHNGLGETAEDFFYWEPEDEE